MHDKRAASGFTLVELMVSIGLMSLMAGYFIYNRLESLKMDLAVNIAQETLTLSNLAVRYYLDNAGKWPDGGAGSNCSGALAAMSPPSADYLPTGYAPLSAATLETRCNTAASVVDNPFELKLVFSNKDSDLVNIVKSMLPMSAQLAMPPGSTTIEIVQRVVAPRREGKKYTFSKFNLNNTAGDPFEVDKPSCPSATPKIMLIPQALCTNDLNGLQGFRFETKNIAGNKWEVKPIVGVLKNPGSPSQKVEMTAAQEKTCDGTAVEIGIITYCE